MTNKTTSAFSPIRAGFGRTISIIVAIFLLFCLLFTALEIVSFNETFYRNTYRTLDIANKTHIEERELMDVTREMLAYLKGDRATLDGVRVTADGTFREFFNNKEKAHMVDVAELLNFGRAARLYMAIAIAALSLINIFSCGKRWIYYTFSGLFWGGLFSFVAFGLLTLIASINFDAVFTAFHKMVFSNDLWMLDSATDLLINIVPQEFFVKVSGRIAMLFGAFYCFFVATGGIVSFASQYAPWKKTSQTWHLRSGYQPVSLPVVNNHNGNG